MRSSAALRLRLLPEQYQTRSNKTAKLGVRTSICRQLLATAWQVLVLGKVHVHDRAVVLFLADKMSAAELQKACTVTTAALRALSLLHYSGSLHSRGRLWIPSTQTVLLMADAVLDRPCEINKCRLYSHAMNFFFVSVRSSSRIPLNASTRPYVRAAAAASCY
ncbi:hypothetical protein HDV63DRAFT_208134 [Trichoderma sp. SZMC 28014]